MPLTTGVEMTEMRSKTNAMKSIIANGVAGLNMIEYRSETRDLADDALSWKE